jgi:hypothetical protein
MPIGLGQVNPPNSSRLHIFRHPLSSFSVATESAIPLNSPPGAETLSPTGRSLTVRERKRDAHTIST